VAVRVLKLRVLIGDDEDSINARESTMTPSHPSFAKLVACCLRLAKDAAKPCEALGFRFAALRYGHSRDLVSGQGAKITGGRLNRTGTFPVIYTSTDPQTALAETFQNFASFGFAKAKVRPKLLVGLEIKIAAILDLCDPRIRRRLMLSLGDLAQPWWPVQEAGGEALTQALGRAAYEAGFEGVRLPSARQKGGINLNVFPGKLRAGSRVVVLAGRDLRQYLK
jgi:RES domain-containing protein